MPTPFPGMDPYLEQPGLWESVHTRLIVAIADALAPIVKPRYRVEVEQRAYLAVLSPDDMILAGIPDVLVYDAPQQAQASTAAGVTKSPAEVEVPAAEQITERYLVVRRVSDREVVTVIELLLPSNKLTRPGREQYEEKRIKVLGSRTHLVEIDLLRAGEPLAMWRQGQTVDSDYRVLVSRAWQRPRAEAYVFSVRDPIPDIPIPLRQGEGEPILPLNQLLHELYDRAGYDLEIDYTRAPLPPLPEADAAWAYSLIQEVSD